LTEDLPKPSVAAMASRLLPPPQVGPSPNIGSEARQ